MIIDILGALFIVVLFMLFIAASAFFGMVFFFKRRKNKASKETVKAAELFENSTPTNGTLDERYKKQIDNLWSYDGSKEGQKEID